MELAASRKHRGRGAALPRSLKVTSYSARNHVHEFRLTSPAEIDAAFQRWLARAYRDGQQRHIRRAGS